MKHTVRDWRFIANGLTGIGIEKREGAKEGYDLVANTIRRSIRKHTAEEEIEIDLSRADTILVGQVDMPEVA